MKKRLLFSLMATLIALISLNINIYANEVNIQDFKINIVSIESHMINDFLGTNTQSFDILQVQIIDFILSDFAPLSTPFSLNALMAELGIEVSTYDKVQIDPFVSMMCCDWMNVQTFIITIYLGNGVFGTHSFSWLNL